MTEVALAKPNNSSVRLNSDRVLDSSLSRRRSQNKKRDKEKSLPQ